MSALLHRRDGEEGSEGEALREGEGRGGVVGELLGERLEERGNKQKNVNLSRLHQSFGSQRDTR